MNRITTIATAAAFGLGSLLCGVQPAQAYQCRYIRSAHVCAGGGAYSVEMPNGDFVRGTCGSGSRMRGFSFVQANTLHSSFCDGERLNP